MAIAWYRPEDWSVWTAISTDKMCETYEKWLKGARQAVLEATRDGLETHRVTITPDEFKKWAEKNGKRLDGRSRSEFASLKIGAQFTKPYDPPKQYPERKEVNKAMREYKAAGGDFSEIFEPYLRRPQAAICPVFRVKSDSEPQQFGSGVLIRFGEDCFLISAAHVLDDLDMNEVLIPAETGMLSLSGRFGRTPLPQEGRESDNIDMAYFHLDASTVKLMNSELVFLDERDCDPLDLTTAGDVYSVIGYPASSSSVSDGQLITGISTYSGEGIHDHRWRSMGLDRRKHLLVQWRAQKAMHYTTLNQGGKRDLSGVSGGGVFAWDKALPDPKAMKQPKLVGIVTLYHPKLHVFVGTRLHVLLGALHKHFPDLPFGYVDHPLD